MAFLINNSSAIFTMFLTMMTYSSALFKNISFRLEKLDIEVRGKIWSQTHQVEMRQEIQRIVEEHENVFRIVRSMEDIMNTAILCIYVLDSITLTFIIFRYISLGVS